MDIDYLANKINFMDEVSSIIYNEWGSLIPGNKIENTQKRIRNFLNKDKIPLCVVCFDNNTLTGVYSLMLNDQANTRGLSPWLGSVYVKPEYRNKGIGTRLVKHALELSKNLGYETLYLHTSDKQALYSRVGFNFIYETNVNGEKVSVMSKHQGNL